MARVVFRWVIDIGPPSILLPAFNTPALIIMFKALVSLASKYRERSSNVAIQPLPDTRPRVAQFSIFSRLRQYPDSTCGEAGNKEAVSDDVAVGKPRPGQRFSSSEDKILLARRRKGVPFQAIADELQRTRAVVNSRYHRLVLLYGMEGPLPKRESGLRPSTFSASDDAMIVQRRAEGLRSSAIAKEMGITGVRAGNRIEARWRNLMLRERLLTGTATPLKQRIMPMTDEDFARIQKLRAQGMKWHTISLQESRSPYSLQECYRHKRRAMNASIDTNMAYGRKWSAEDSATLMRLRDLELCSWEEISQRLNRSKAAVKDKHRLIELAPVASRPIRTDFWTKEEDSQLLEIIRTYGLQWMVIQSLMPIRTMEAKRGRYNRYLRQVLDDSTSVSKQSTAPDTART